MEEALENRIDRPAAADVPKGMQGHPWAGRELRSR